ncbi:MAG: GWxTD domain-containing protein [Calditrichaeota bacterium]|nr:GWxTD domain-containing protein [Calditrichota bacterium]
MYDLPGQTLKQNKLLVIFRVPYDNLLFEKQKDSFFASILWTLTIQNKDKSTAFTRDYRDTLRVAHFKETVSQKDFLQHVQTINLKPGEYTLLIRLNDQISHAVSIRRGDFEARNFDSNRVTFGDPIILKSPPGDSLDIEDIIPPFVPIQQDSFDVYVDIVSPAPQTTLQLSVDLQQLNGKSVLKKDGFVTSTSKRAKFYTTLHTANLSDQHYKLKISAVHVKSRPVYQYLWLKKKINALLKGNISAIIGPLQYVMNYSDWIRLKHAPPEQQKELFKKFWEKRNPLPDSPTNPLLEEFYRRVQFANENFSSSGAPGWQTDRGRIYIIYGPPDDIYRNDANLFSNEPPYIIWTYNNLRLRFVFVDELNIGDYRLVSRETF